MSATAKRPEILTDEETYAGLIALGFSPASARLIVAAPDMLGALRQIARNAPTEEPEYGDWGGDTERAESWGGNQEHWRCAEIARAALAKVEGAAS